MLLTVVLNFPHLGATRPPSVSVQASTYDFPLITPSCLSYWLQLDNVLLLLVLYMLFSFSLDRLSFLLESIETIWMNIIILIWTEFIIKYEFWSNNSYWISHHPTCHRISSAYNSSNHHVVFAVVLLDVNLICCHSLKLLIHYCCVAPIYKLI